MISKQQNWVCALLLWFAKEQRQLPWRKTAENKPEPWQIWVSEVMLQQTTVATVIPKYKEFMEKWPSFAALSCATEDDILHFWQGLGYYSRGRNLYKAIEQINNDYNGRLPQTALELKKLAGFGDYTAAAVAAIAFNEKAAAIDGNVARVLARFWLMDDMGEKLKSKQREKLQAFIPPKAGDFAQALIELGALICRPLNPQCGLCPIKAECKAYKTNQSEKYPKKQQKKPLEERNGQFYIIQNPQKEILFLKRPSWGLLASMHVLPSNDWYKDGFAFHEQRLANFEDRVVFLHDFGHIFTHIRLKGRVYAIDIKGNEQKLWNEGLWVAPSFISTLALPTVIKKALKNVYES